MFTIGLLFQNDYTSFKRGTSLLKQRPMDSGMDVFLCMYRTSTDTCNAASHTCRGGPLCIVVLTNVESLQIPNTTYIVDVIRF